MPHPARNDGAPSADELVLRVRAGETDAFAEIVRRFEGDLWKVSSALLGDRAATEVLVHRSFVQAYERLDQYQIGRDLGRWLKAIARNLAREELRRSSREHDRLLRYHEYLRALDAGGARTEAEVARLEEAVRGCRKKLSPAAARALVLRYEEARSLEEVAAALGRTLPATRQLLFRTRERIRACVERKLASR